MTRYQWYHSGTYGLELLGSWKLCARIWWLSGGGWGRRAGSTGCGAPCAGDWITPFTPSWGLPASDAMSPPTTGRAEPAGASASPRLNPFSGGCPKEAGLGWGGGVLWKEREELLRDRLPE